MTVLEFLNNFSSKIDCLYLDSFDGHDSIKASEHQLREARASIDKLHNNSLVLLDDKGAKTNLSIDYYRETDISYCTKVKIKFFYRKIIM